MSNALSENWQFTTIAIEDDLGEQVGTGVLIGETAVSSTGSGYRLPSWTDPTRAYLVTARHVLGKTRSEIESTLHYVLRYNATTARGLELRTKRFDLSNSPANWSLHPDEKVDVAALDVTEWLYDTKDAHVRVCPLSEVASPVSILQMECDAGDDVFVIGYPLRLRQGASNLPIFRKGIAATSPRRPLIDGGGSRRGFLVDGAIMPGSSGSPVISTSGRYHPGDLAVTTHRPLLIGIVAEEWGRSNEDRRKVSLPNELTDGYANLGFAHSSSTIIETLVALGHHTKEDFLRLDHDQNWAAQLGIPEWALEMDGNEVDSTNAFRVMNRRNRDRMRKAGRFLAPDPFHDAPELMGPVTLNPASDGRGNSGSPIAPTRGRPPGR